VAVPGANLESMLMRRHDMSESETPTRTPDGRKVVWPYRIVGKQVIFASLNRARTREVSAAVARGDKAGLHRQASRGQRSGGDR
jgi:hypothetical protein